MRGTTIARHKGGCPILETEYFVHHGSVFVTNILKNGKKENVAWHHEHFYTREKIEVGGNLCRYCNAEMPVVTSRDDAPKTEFGRWVEKLLFGYEWETDKEPKKIETRREAGGIEITLTRRPRVIK